MAQKGGQEGNTNSLKHGGAAARLALSKGEPFTGLAAVAEQEVVSELAAGGRSSMVHKGAQRLEAATRLYWAAFTKACDNGDISEIQSFVRVFGWLQSKTLLAWQQSHAMAKDEEQAPDIEAIRSKYTDESVDS